MNHSIVLIDDNFSIRQIVKIFLARLSRKYALDLKVFTSDNGVEGLGFVFITTPSLVIIDTTLPKYSGREVLDFLVNNPKFHSDLTKVIVLHEGEQKNLNLPKNFSIINKNDKDSFKNFSELVFNILNISDPSHSDDLFNKLSRFVLKNSNQDDLLNKSIEQQPLFKRFFLRFKWTWLELSTSLVLTLIILLFGRADDENITQQDIDKKAFRTKYYPTLVVTFISLTIIFINVGLFLGSQISLYKNQQEIARALVIYQVDSKADTADDTPGDGFCDTDDSVGDGPCTLRAAIEEANTEVDDVTINFAIKETVSTITNISDQLQGNQGNADSDQLTHFSRIDSNGNKHFLFHESPGDAGGRDIFYYRSDIPIGVSNPVNVSTALPGGYGSGTDYANDLVVDASGVATILFTSQGVRGSLDVYLAKYDENGLVGTILNLSDQLQAGEGTDNGFGSTLKLDASGDPIVVFLECCGGQGSHDVYLYDSNNPISATNPHNLSVSLSGSQGGGGASSSKLEIKNNIAYVAWAESNGLRGASDMYYYDNSQAVSATNPRNLSNSISNGAWGTTDVEDQNIQFLVTASGVAYVIWGEDGPQNFNADIFLFRSDQGISATNPLNISNKLTSNLKDEFTLGGDIDVDSSGNPYIVWSEAGTLDYHYRSYLYRGNTDTVINLSDKVDPLNTISNTNSQDPKIEVLDDDSIHVLFIDSNGTDADTDLFYYQPNLPDSGSNPANLSNLLSGSEGTGTSGYAQLVDRPGGTVFSSWTESMGARGGYDMYNYDISLGPTATNPRNLSNLLPSGEGLLDTFPSGVRAGNYPNNSKINFDSGGYLRQSWIEENGARGYMDLYMIEDNLELTNNVQTILPGSALPTITKDNISINGESQNGSSCTTKTLNIEIDGTSAGSTNGLTVSSGAASAVSLRGLVLNHFGTSEITVTDSNQVNITCNIIGLDADGATMEIGGAGGDGIIATGNSHLVIGGSTASDRNIISGTGDDGIIISGSSTANIQGNFIGTDKTGLLDKGNDDVGITITSSGQGTIIGGNTSLNPGVECAGSCNLISGNGPGIYIARDSLDPYLDSNLSILGNFIGTDKTGSATIGNVSGISITYADGITIGGANTNERNIISGNTQNGIYLYSAHTNRVQDLIIQYNYIGTDNAGTSALGNSLNGVLAFNHMPDLTITGNTISSNGTNGISTDLTLSNAPVDSINIFSNNIGTRSDGTGDLGNAYSGISLLGRGQVNIGAQNQGNIINNSGHRGVTVNSAPNPDPPSATISADIRYNTISGNDQGGILAYWNDHLILNNIINSNTGSGIEYLAGSDISIIANQISNNTDKGVSLPSNFVPTGAKIGRNYIYANSFNIDLADNGRTSNDVDDVDTGANNLQNYPELASSEIDGTTLSIFGTFNSIPSEYYLLEFFSTDLGVAVAGDTKSYLGFSVINTDVNGDVNFSSTPLTLNSITLDPGETYLTAIASRCVDANCTLTENAIETSEISNSVEITQIAPSDTPTPTPTETPVPSDTPIPGPTDTPVPGASDTPVPTLTNTPLPTLTNTPLPTVTNTPVPVPTDTPVPAPSSTTAPAVVLSPTVVSTLAGTRTPVPTASDTPTVTPTEGFVTSESTPTPSITPVPTIETPIVTDTPSSSTSYVPPEESVVNLPVVKSMSLALANSVQDVPVLGSLLDNAIEFSGRIKPLTDNLSYLLSLQFVGSSVASSGVTAINLLALAAPAIASTFAQPRLFYYALAWFWKRKSKLPWGIISDKFSHSPVAFARVTLVKDGQRIDSQTTDLQGKYGFMADKGEYQIFITHPDYTDFSKEISVKYDGQTLAQDFELNSKAQQDFGSSLTWVFYQARKFIKQNLFILNTIIFSTGFVYTVFAVANSLTVFNYIILSLYLLQIVLIMVFYFTASKKWGQVLDVSTGEAIPGAIVRLLNNERQLDVAITDLQGRYNFILEPGEYYLKVSAPGYMFPTDDTPNVVVNQAGEKLMKFSVEKTERLSIKLYMQKFSNVQVNRNAILSPFN